MALKASLLFLQHLGITRSSAYQLNLLGATSSWSLGPSLASSEQSSSGFGQQPEGSSRTERPLPTLWFLFLSFLVAPQAPGAVLAGNSSPISAADRSASPFLGSRPLDSA